MIDSRGAVRRDRNRVAQGPLSRLPKPCLLTRSPSSISTRRAPTSAAADSIDELDDLRKRLIGKSSVAARVKQSIKDLPADQKPVVGKAVSEYTAAVTEALDAPAGRARLPAGAERTARSTSPSAGTAGARGHLHLVTQCQRELEDVFVSLGYRVAEGPEVEDDWHNFEALNFPPGAPGAGDAGHALRRTWASPSRSCCARTPRRCRSG